MLACPGANRGGDLAEPRGWVVRTTDGELASQLFFATVGKTVRNMAMNSDEARHAVCTSPNPVSRTGMSSTVIASEQNFKLLDSSA